MLRLILSTDWVANHDNIMERLCEDVRAERSGRILLVPEQISHDTERELCRLAGDTASRYGEVLSFTRLASRIFAITGGAARQTMDGGGRIIAMAAAVEQLRPRLKAYAAASAKPEFLTGLVDAVDECKSCCVTAAGLLAASARTEGALAQKLEELSLLLEGYNAICANGRLDPRDRMTKLLEQMESCDFAKTHAFYIDGFGDFTAQELAVLAHLLESGADVTVTLCCDAPGSTLQGCDIAGETARQLLRLAEKEQKTVRISHPAAAQDALAPVRSRLFSGETDNLRLQDCLEVSCCPSDWAECLHAAERVQKLLRQGARFREISVAYTDSHYALFLRLIFERLEIPAYFSGTEDILHKSVMHMAVTALEAAAGGLERRDVLRYLKSILSPLEAEQCDRLENYVILWGIGGQSWGQTWKLHPAGRGKEFDEASAQALRDINTWREKGIMPLVRLRQKLLRAANTREQIRALYEFLEEIGVEAHLTALSEAMQAEQDYASAQELSQLWEILIGALEQMEELLGDTVRDADAFARLLRLQLSQYNVGTIPPVLDRVTVGELSAMRRKKTAHLILLGAAEGGLPGYGGGGGVLTQTEREALVAMGLGLTGGASWNLQQDFATIRAVFSCPRETLSVSCGGSQPAFLFRRLCRMAGRPEGVAAAPEDWRFDPWAAGAVWARAGKEASLLPEQAAKICRLGRLGADYSLGALDFSTVQSLYGRILQLSASQVDKLALCRFAYFLRYGLRAQPRKDNRIEPTEFGSFVHDVLEHTAREVMEKGGFHQVSLEETQIIAGTHAERYMNRYFSDLEEASTRTTYLFRRNLAELRQVVKELWEELSRSDFTPAGFEVAFGSQPGALPPVAVENAQMEAVVRGFVDRVDVAAVNGRRYVRVVDYKTGRKDFDYCDVSNGIGLQMLLYLFALKSGGEPAGVQYFPARVPVLPAPGPVTEAEAEAMRRKSARRNGLVLAEEPVSRAMDAGEEAQYLPCKRKKDGTLTGDLATAGQFAQLEKYLAKLLRRMVNEIAAGEIAPNPYFRGEHNACRFCEYSAVCQQEGAENQRSFRAMTAKEFWTQLDKEENHGGD